VEDYDVNKSHAERRFDDFGNETSNLPDNVVGLTGEQVGRVEGFGDCLEI